MKASVPAARGWCCFLGADACSAASMIPALFLYQPLQSAAAPRGSLQVCHTMVYLHHMLENRQRGWKVGAAHTLQREEEREEREERLDLDNRERGRKEKIPVAFTPLNISSSSPSASSVAFIINPPPLQAHSY
ncbi:hypothetical protein NQZ68_008612 [Dissostichus eleginoides]|nr:hypothetical protein NQZ68_008612 [Dissostichus eleginoides]